MSVEGGLYSRFAYFFFFFFSRHKLGVLGNLVFCTPAIFFVPQPNSFGFIYEPAVAMYVRKFLLYIEIDFFVGTLLRLA